MKEAAQAFLLAAVITACAACSGSPSRAGDPIAATPPSTRSPTTSCADHHLAARFHGGGLSAGASVGGIAIGNLDRTPCLLSGSVTVRPLDAGHRVISSPSRWRNHTLLRDLVLPARGRRLQAWIDVGGEYRDDPGAPRGLCRARDEVMPAFWRVRIPGHVFVVRNRDQHYGSAVYACHAHFTNISVGTTNNWR